MNKYIKYIKILAIVLLVVIIGILTYYNYAIGSISKDDKEIIFVVSKDSTFNSISNQLVTSGLIRNELIYKVYIKLNNPVTLKAGTYKFSKAMSLNDIVTILESGSSYNPDVVTLQIPEGKNIEQIAALAATVTTNTSEQLIAYWDSKVFVDKVIAKYWFIDNDILKIGIRHPLEGYLFPSTYELLNKDVTPEYIAYKLLDQMDIILTKYKNAIDAQDLTIHELLTLTSIVQYESGETTVMKDIAGVFYNRLAAGWKLQSSVTVCYAIGDVKHWTDCEFNSSLKSPYNTYYYAGLPIGPILNFGEAALSSTLNPNDNNYFFFLANVCDPKDTKTYFSTTLAQHNKYKAQYLTCY